MADGEDTFSQAEDRLQNISVNRVGMKLPPFQKKDPEIWFAILERSFVLSGVTTDETKFSYAIQGLDVDAQLEVRDLLLNPPHEHKYNTLKTELLKRLTKTLEQRHKQLLEREELGDSKPSQFLRRLKNLSGPSVSDELLRTLWVGRLPRPMQGILATQKKTSLEEVAELADAIAEAEYPLRSIAPISQPLGLEAIQKEIASLRLEISEMRATPRVTNRERSTSRSSARSNSRSSDGACWYHKRFKNKARKCLKPCSFQNSGNAEGSF